MARKKTRGRFSTRTVKMGDDRAPRRGRQGSAVTAKPPKAKKEKAPRYDPFKGQKLADLVQITPQEFRNMDARKRAALVTRLSSAANKRVRRMEAAGVTSWELEKVKREGAFTAKGKEGAALEVEFLRLRNFLTSEGGTVRGARKQTERLQSDLAEILQQYDLDVETGELLERDTETDKAIKIIMSEYLDQGLAYGYDSDQLLEVIKEIVEFQSAGTGRLNLEQALDKTRYELFGGDFRQWKVERAKRVEWTEIPAPQNGSTWFTFYD